ncbi:MAG: hypothetical protein AAF961_09705 [Planctomycetota bacterium]
MAVRLRTGSEPQLAPNGWVREQRGGYAASQDPEHASSQKVGGGYRRISR